MRRQMAKSSSYFIWTEVYNAGKIGKVAVESFLKYHELPLHVYGTREDFKWLPVDARVKMIELPAGFWLPDFVFRLIIKYQGKDSRPFLTTYILKRGFQTAHLGTAMLWAYLILTRSEEFMVHFDSDVIFRARLIDEILEASGNYDLVGPVRNYKNNPNGRDDIRSLSDITQTCLFGFRRTLITRRSFDEMIRMCRGYWNPLGHPVIDFFDPVMFDMLKNGGKIKFLDVDDVGGCTLDGNRKNIFAQWNDFSTPYKIDFGRKLIHFSAVASGMNAHNNPSTVKIPPGYRQYALDRYALFCKVFYNEDIGINLDAYSDLTEAVREAVR
jgi:hypothetical protein